MQFSREEASLEEGVEGFFLSRLSSSGDAERVKESRVPAREGLLLLLLERKRDRLESVRRDKRLSRRTCRPKRGRRRARFYIYLAHLSHVSLPSGSPCDRWGGGAVTDRCLLREGFPLQQLGTGARPSSPLLFQGWREKPVNEERKWIVYRLSPARHPKRKKEKCLMPKGLGGEHYQPFLR